MTTTNTQQSRDIKGDPGHLNMVLVILFFY